MFVLQHMLSDVLIHSTASTAPTVRDASSKDVATDATSVSASGLNGTGAAAPACARQPGSNSQATQHLASLRAVLKQEFGYVAQQVAVASRNESPWNYLWGLFALPGCPSYEMARHEEVRQWRRQQLCSGWCMHIICMMPGHVAALHM